MSPGRAESYSLLQESLVCYDCSEPVMFESLNFGLTPTLILCVHSLSLYTGLFKWLSGYNCPAAIPHQILETATIGQFHSKVVCAVSRARVRVYPGTEGTNQNRH